MPSIKDCATSKVGILAGTSAAAATALWVSAKARKAEREHPPLGRFIEADGARLHYIDRGTGSPVVLLHGNAVTHDDFEASGYIDRLAEHHRVLAFDRPGFGHSSRPRSRMWTPSAQAKAINSALAQLGISSAVVVGHSMGTLVALAMALEEPQSVRALVLLGGYYYRTARLDVLNAAPLALPFLGDFLRYTVAPLWGRALFKRTINAVFAPNEVPPLFVPTLSREMMLRPVQLRANAEDATYVVPAASSFQKRYKELRMPVTIVAGADDKVVSTDDHSIRLHGDIAQSELIVVPACGHMVHYIATEQIIDAIAGQLKTSRCITDVGSTAYAYYPTALAEENGSHHAV